MKIFYFKDTVEFIAEDKLERAIIFQSFITHLGYESGSSSIKIKLSYLSEFLNYYKETSVENCFKVDSFKVAVMKAALNDL